MLAIRQAEKPVTRVSSVETKWLVVVRNDTRSFYRFQKGEKEDGMFVRQRNSRKAKS